MYKRMILCVVLLVTMAVVSSVAFAEDTPTSDPDPDEAVAVELPTTPPQDIDDTPITTEQREEAAQAIAEMEPPVARERAGIIKSSHRKTVGVPTEWVVAIGVGITTIVSIVGIAGGRQGRKH